MTDEPTSPDHASDGFGDQLHDRLASTADHVDGSAVTRSGVRAAVAARHRRTRARSALAVAAALLVVVGGVAVASPGDDGGQRVASVASTTEPAAEPCLWEGRGEWAGWIELTEPQREVLRSTGMLQPDAAAGRVGAAYHLDWSGYRALAAADGGLSGKQLFQLGYQSVLPLLSDGWSGSLSDPQRAEIEAGVYPTLDQAQVEALFGEFDMDAVPAGGLPITAAGAEYFSGAMFTQEQVEAIVEYERTLRAPTGAEPVPCDEGDATGRSGTATTLPIATTSTSTTAVVGSTDPSGSTDEPARWILYLYVLDGRRNADGSITTGIERMGEISNGSEPGEQQRAVHARAVADEADLDGLWDGALNCDEGATTRLGLDPALEPLAMSVWFSSEDAARTVFEQLEATSLPDLQPAVRVEQWCTGRDSEG